MKAFLEIVILIGMSSLISACVLTFKMNESRIRESVCLYLPFFILFYYGLLSAVQMVLGNGELTLRDSFAEVSAKKYVLWLVGAVLCGFLSALVIKKYLQGKHIIWMHGFTTLQFIATVVLHILFGKTNNYFYSTIFFICFILAFFQIGKKPWNTLIEEQELRQRIKYAAPIALFHVTLIALYTPFELYMTNITEFTIEIGIFIGILSVNAAAIFILLMCGCIVFSNKTFEIFYTAIFAFTCMGYIQSTFLNGQMQPMEGNAQTWSASEQLQNGGIWVVFILLIVILIHKFNDKTKKLYSVLSVYATLTLVLSGVLVYFTVDKSGADKGYLVTNEMFELHEENNVIVFVLDFLDTQILEDVYETNENILQPLNDFIYYPNATSRYAFTGSSIPYLLSGVEAQNIDQITTDEYWEYASDNNRFLQQISEMGYDIEVYTDARYVGEYAASFVSNYSKDAEKEYLILGTIDFIDRTSKYKILPFAFKNIHWYSSSEVINLARVKQEYSCVNDIPFYNQLASKGIQVTHDEKKGAFKFYHLYGAHAPFVMNENIERISTKSDTDLSAAINSQTIGVLKIVYEYIEQLKANDLYDSSTIIITADHGHSYLLDKERLRQAEIYGFEQTSNPILFVKAAGQCFENLKVNRAPVSHSEIHATIIEAMHGEYSSYGKTIWEIGEDEVRERKYLFGKKGMKYREFLVTGDVRDINSWKLLWEMESQ